MTLEKGLNTKPKRGTKSRYVKVGTSIWTDTRFMLLSPLKPSGQALWIYLITCPFAESIPGLIPIGRMALTEALGWSLEEFDLYFEEIAKQGMAEADWDRRTVWIPRAIFHNPPGNVNILKHWFAELEKIADSPLKAKAIACLCEYCNVNGEGFAKAFQEAFPKSLPEGFLEAFANSNSNSNSDSGSSGEEVREVEDNPSQRALREENLVLPSIVDQQLKSYIPEVRMKAWRAVHLYRNQSPGPTGTATLAKLATHFADAITKNGQAEGILTAYFSVLDAEQLDSEAKAGKRLTPGASPWDIVTFLFGGKKNVSNSRRSAANPSIGNSPMSAGGGRYEGIKPRIAKDDDESHSGRPS